MPTVLPERAASAAFGLPAVVADTPRSAAATAAASTSRRAPAAPRRSSGTLTGWGFAIAAPVQAAAPSGFRGRDLRDDGMAAAQRSDRTPCLGGSVEVRGPVAGRAGTCACGAEDAARGRCVAQAHHALLKASDVTSQYLTHPHGPTPHPQRRLRRASRVVLRHHHQPRTRQVLGAGSILHSGTGEQKFASQHLPRCVVAAPHTRLRERIYRELCLLCLWRSFLPPRFWTPVSAVLKRQGTCARTVTRPRHC